MTSIERTKKQLIDELVEIRKRNSRKEQELQRLREKYKYIYCEGPALFLTIGMDMKIKDINKATRKNFGYSKSELIGKNVLEFVVPEHRNKASEQLRKALNGEKNPELEIDVYAKDGSVHTVLISRDQVVLYKRDHPIGILIVGTDITNQSELKEELRKSEKKYKAFFENTGMPTIIIEEDNTISLVNTEFERLSGFSKREIENKKKWTEFVAEGDLKRMGEFHRIRIIGSKKAPNKYEFLFINRERNIRNILLSVSLIPDTKRCVASFLDITERKQAAEAISTRNVLLQEKNIALREVMEQVKLEKEKTEEHILTNVDRLVLPLLTRIKEKSSQLDRIYINLLEENLRRLTSPFGREISRKALGLTPKEIEICNMITSGMTSKEIASVLHVSCRTVDTHRANIRKKLELKKRKINLITYLKSLKVTSPL